MRSPRDQMVAHDLSGWRSLALAWWAFMFLVVLFIAERSIRVTILQRKIMAIADSPVWCWPFC